MITPVMYSVPNKLHNIILHAITAHKVHKKIDLD